MTKNAFSLRCVTGIVIVQLNGHEGNKYTAINRHTAILVYQGNEISLDEK